MTAAAAATPAPTITTAPVYLPHYNNESWKPVRGSILGIDSTANETTYTIFCPSATQPTCDLNVEIPFIIVNGPGTVHWSGSITSQFTAYLGCDLVGTTEATCSGYSSYGPRFPPGPPSQSTKINWTSTLSGSAVQWGTLTLVDLPATATDDGSSSSGSPTAQTSNEFYYTPEPTNAGTRPTLSLWSVSAASLGSLLLAAGFVSV
ncbi:hypothetical protein GMORB2_0588 [Geosmithia morbida]|uniref:Uncharacterized protein n=1 Tax=Geosmithia morbida TaxID=1094350 RepID=A0A9P4Z3I4_9HYPO|nr:uncharacterized protein GMORB2_0588 [Geosmithia morbida]KAF4126851.1 hypothetical protein GMORB2_0588 [Geosmithia morbida]